MKRVIALVLVLSMLMLTGCDAKSAIGDVKATINGILGKEESTTEMPTETQPDIFVDNNTPSDSNIQVTEPTSQTQSQDQNQKPGNDGQASNSSKPETTAQIVEYFNKNGNRVKTEATKVVKNYEDREVSNVQAPKAVQGMAESLIGDAFKDDTEPIVYATREEIVENFQVPKQSYVSVLTANDVAEASCVDNGGQYVITIRVKDEKNPVTGKGVGAAFDIIEANEVQSKAEGIVKDFSTDYHNCVVKAVFDKATNRMVAANYMVRLKLFVTVNLMGTHDASMDLSFEKDYTITY